MSYLIVLFAVLTRFAPHPPNFSPVYGALLFGGARLKPRDALWYPIALLGLSDVLLTTQVYHLRWRWAELLQLPAFAAVALVGLWLGKRSSAGAILAASLAGPTAFFLTSNLSVWLGWKLYPITWEGLVACYLAALPFFRNSLLSGVLFSGLLFGAYELYRRKFVNPPHDSVAPVG